MNSGNSNDLIFDIRCNEIEDPAKKLYKFIKKGKLELDRDQFDFLLEDYLEIERSISFFKIIKYYSTIYPIASMIYFASLIDSDTIPSLIKHHLEIEMNHELIKMMKFKNKMCRYNIKRFELSDVY